MNSHLILPICAKPNHAERNSPLSYFPPGARRRGVPPPHSLAVHLAFSLALLHLLSSSSWFLCATLSKSCMWISFLFIADKFAIDSQAKSEFLWLGTLVCAGMYPQWAWYPQVGKNLLTERMAKFFSTFKLVAASIKPQPIFPVQFPPRVILYLLTPYNVPR